MDLNVKHYAHIGDAVYEVFIREHTVYLTASLKNLHEYTIFFVNASYQTELLNKLIPYLNEYELDIARRARNIPTSGARRINRSLHSSATSFEAVLGYLYINDKTRYKEICNIMESLIDFNECLNA